MAAGLVANTSTTTTVVFRFCSHGASLARVYEQHDNDLAFDIAYALSQRRKTLRRIPTHDGIEHLRLVAKAVIQHLKLCGWRLEKKPPMKAHTSGPSEDCLMR